MLFKRRVNVVGLEEYLEIIIGNPYLLKKIQWLVCLNIFHNLPIHEWSKEIFIDIVERVHQYLLGFLTRNADMLF